LDFGNWYLKFHSLDFAFLLSVMITEKEVIRISKFLSLVLRHQPETIGVVLDENGWTPVTTLLEKMQAAGTTINLPLLKEVVATNSKQRFAFSEDESMIRANQGHSVGIDLAFEPIEPPTVLYHGTSEHVVAAILKEGLQKRSRHHVHLSADVQTVRAVGQRYGKPVVLIVAALQMHKEGYPFYQSANGVWLTEHVPPVYLQIIKQL